MALSKARWLYVGAACIALLPTETAAQQAVDAKDAPKVNKGKSAKPGTAAKAGKDAQETGGTNAADPVVSGESGRLEGDIVVIGLRENVKTARNAKRNAQQIVDVVVAQDIGKLPDKNVPEALARVPGVQLDRSRGEGGSIRIRGLEGVMTTVNGSSTFSAGDRTTYLNDISSDLVAAIEVFKTRTPDQVEGSQTGVVNLTLRRPTDFKGGATYTLNLKGDYNDQSKRWNPYGNALVAYNADTPIGQLGFLVNGTYNDLKYNESIRWNGFPVRPGDNRQIIDPGTTPSDIFVPDQVGFTYRRGWIKRAAFSSSAQWRPADHWKITLEGGYSNQKMAWLDDQFNIPITFSQSAAPPPRLTNVVIGADGRQVASLSGDSVDPYGPGKQSWLHETSNYNGRFQVEYASERFELGGWLNYVRSNNYSDNIFAYYRFAQQPSFDVEFNTTKDPRGGQNLTFKNVDLLDAANYRFIDGYNQSRQYTKSAEKEAKFDLKLNTFASTIDYLKVGFRYATRSYDRQYGDRGQGGMQIPIALLSNYTLTPVGQGFNGTVTSSNANWLSADSGAVRRNWNTFRALAAPISSSLAKSYYPDYNPRDTFTGSDGSYAFYGMAHYNIKLIFPIDGTIGARIVNTVTDLKANRQTFSSGLVNGFPGTVETITPITARNNYLDVLPSINAIVHIDSKLQLRAAYTYDVGRPNVNDLNPGIRLDALNTARPTARAGTPDLGPVKLTKYDLSLEYYFGQTGSLSLSAWQWYHDGFVFLRQAPEILPGFDVPVFVERPVNSGKGRHKGIEASATTFFTFLPGFLKSFGGSANFTYNDTNIGTPSFSPTGEYALTYGPYFFVSKYIYNVIGFFERDGLNIRVAYNWRSRREVSRNAFNPYDNQFIDPVERLDASINYDINKNLTIALEAANLTRAGEQSYWGTKALPRDIVYYSRNFSLSARAKF